MKELVRQGEVKSRTQMERLSVRYRLRGTTLKWFPPRRRGLLPGRRKAVKAELVDLSVVGGLVRAPMDEAIQVGMRVPIAIGNEEGLVEVRNIRRGEQTGESFYGVTFHEISPAFRETIYEAIARLRNEARLRSPD